MVTANAPQPALAALFADEDPGAFAQRYQFECHTCDYASPIFDRQESTAYDDEHRTETGHSTFYLYEVTRSTSQTARI